MTTVDTRQMSRAELVDEVRWLLDGGTHPYLAAQLLGRRPESVVKAARLCGAEDVAEAFLAVTRRDPPWSPV